MKKLIILGGAGLLILALLGTGGVILWKRIAARRALRAQAAATQPQAPVEEHEEEETSGGEHGSGPVVMVYQKIVNLDRKNAYLKVEFHLLFRDQELGRAATSDKPTPEASEIRALMLELLSGKTFEEAADLETRESLRTEIKDRLNERFGPKPPKPGEKPKDKEKRPRKPIKDVLVVDWAISA